MDTLIAGACLPADNGKFKEIILDRLALGVRVLHLAHILAMANYEGLWTDKHRRAVLDMNLPNVMLRVGEKLLHCTSWVAYCDCDTCVNKKLWRIMDAAFDHCDVSLAIQLKSGARSRKVTEKRLVGQAVKNYDRLWAVGSKMREEARVSVFVTPDLKDRLHQELSDDIPRFHVRCKDASLSGCLSCKGLTFDATTHARHWRSSYAPHQEDGCLLNEAMEEVAGFMTRLACDMNSVCLACGKEDSPELPHKRCAYCRTATYCSSACQKADWKAGHKAICLKPKA